MGGGGGGGHKSIVLCHKLHEACLLSTDPPEEVQYFLKQRGLDGACACVCVSQHLFESIESIFV